VSKYTHVQPVEIARKWLSKQLHCGYVVTEVTSSAGEIPDALGLRADYTVLVECKVSRNDFLADKKKLFRQSYEDGMGDFRFYLCPVGMIKEDDLPQGWGLLYWDGKKVAQIVGPSGNIWSRQKNFIFTKNRDKEYRLIYSCLRRIAKEKGEIDVK